MTARLDRPATRDGLFLWIMHRFAEVFEGNERRLLRDLYDCTFLSARAGVVPDDDVLDTRLSKIESRLPGARKRRTMSRAELAAELRDGVAGLSDDDCQRELSGLVPADELAGLALRIRASVAKLADHVAGHGNPTA